MRRRCGFIVEVLYLPKACPPKIHALVAFTVVEGGVIFVVVFVGSVLSTIVALTVVVAIVVVVSSVAFGLVGNGFALATSPVEAITNRVVVIAEVVEIVEFVVAFKFKIDPKLSDLYP